MTLPPGFLRYLCAMAESLGLSPESSRQERYAELSSRWEALLGIEPNRVANLANIAAVLKEAFGWHWVGFYLVDFERDELVLGPFQGPLACTRLFHGKGVCAAAWGTKEVQLVPDVHAFEGHVACSSLTASELVLPVVVNGQAVAVLDIDSVTPGDFTSADVEGMNALMDLLSNQWLAWE